MNNLDKQYLKLIKHVLDHGHKSGDRTGTGTIKTFGNLISHDMREGFPLLTIKKMFTKGIIYELLWFLRGDTNIKYMVDNGVNIWVGDCYKKYKTHFENLENLKNADIYELYHIKDEFLENNGKLVTLKFEIKDEKQFIQAIKDDFKLNNGQTFSQKWGELNKVYGAEWVNWDDNINQIQELIDTLKTNPDSRRLMVTAWNPTNVKKAVLPPCHYGFQVFTRELSTEERYILAYKHAENVGCLPLSVKINNNGINWDEVKKTIDNSNFNIPTREISLMFQMRSVDVGLGLPFDITSYGFLLSMIAQVVNMVPGELKCCLGDTHIYNDHIEPIKELFNREYMMLPTLKLNKNITDIFDFKYEDIEILDYESNDKLILPLSN